MSQSMMLWFWLGAGALLMLLELVLPGAVVVFLGLGAWVVALAVYLGFVDTWMSSFTLWFISSLVLLFTLRSLGQKYLSGDSERRSTDEDLDAFGTVVDVVEGMKSGEEGRIKFRGTTWKAVCYETDLEPGARAKIVYRENLVWVLEPVPESEIEPSLGDLLP